MVILVAAASTSILFAAFYRVTQRPDYHKRHHVYSDDDGEAVSAEHDRTGDRTVRILIAFFALAAFLLSAWNWTVQQQNAGLAIITIAWVCYQSNFLSTFLIRSADDHRLGILPTCSTIDPKTTTIRCESAHSRPVTHIITGLGNCDFQGISESNRILVPGGPWSLPGSRMLLFATATWRVSQR